MAKDPSIEDVMKWIAMSDRRLIALRGFKKRRFIGAAEVAQDAGRSIQNVAHALSELEAMSLVQQLEPGRRTWKKFELTPTGREVLNAVEENLSTGVFERIADELSLRFVKDAYRLVVTKPIVVRKNMGLLEVVHKVLSDPRTRSAYVVDDRGRLVGMLGLSQMLLAVHGSLSVFNHSKAQQKGKRPPLPFTVEEYMVRPVTVNENDALLKALEKMIRHRLEDLPVVDHRGVLVGELNGFEILLLGTEIMGRQRTG